MSLMSKRNDARGYFVITQRLKINCTWLVAYTIAFQPVLVNVNMDLMFIWKKIGYP